MNAPEDAARPKPDRMRRLREDPALREEARTLRIMIARHCRDLHGTAGSGRPGTLCPACAEFLHYALRRLACCPFGGGKPVCGRCRIHCYRADMREAARRVMRHSGPKLALGHPVLSLRHLVKSLTVTPPERPRNRGRNAGGGKTGAGG